MKWYQSTLAEKIYTMACEGKNFIFDAGLADTLRLKTPVISVGNLTVGGTGKTPFTQMLLTHFKEKGIRAAVIGRSYKAGLNGTARVKTDDPKAAYYFGDEPTLLAQRNPQVPVFVGPSKWWTAHYAERHADPDIIIIDDGFQHRSLHRDLDLVLLDCSARPEDYRVLPKGKGREGFENIRRADFVILSKVNLVDEQKLQEVRQLLPKEARVVELAYRLESPVEDAGKKVLAIAGLAQPRSFKRSLAQDTMYDLVEFLAFPDHHMYTARDWREICASKTSHGAELIVMTEKDFVKLAPLIQELKLVDAEQIRVLPLQTYILQGATELYQAVDQLL